MELPTIPTIIYLITEDFLYLLPRKIGVKVMRGSGLEGLKFPIDCKNYRACKISGQGK